MPDISNDKQDQSEPFLKGFIYGLNPFLLLFSSIQETQNIYAEIEEELDKPLGQSLRENAMEVRKLWQSIIPFE